jgi:putative transposase
VTRPRIRAADGSGELPVASCELFSGTEVLGRMALERMLSGLSTRRYPVGLEPVGTRTEKTATATSRSAVSRRFVAQTETALADLLAADLSGLDLVALMVDGVHFGEHICIVALGIDIDGLKHPLSLVEGSTENATLVTVNRPGFGGGSLVEFQATRLVRSPASYRASNSVGGLPPQAP